MKCNSQSPARPSFDPYRPVQLLRWTIFVLLLSLTGVRCCTTRPSFGACLPEGHKSGSATPLPKGNSILPDTRCAILPTGMKAYRCPVCKKPLTEKEYDRALGIQRSQHEPFHRREIALQRQIHAAKAKEKAARQAGIKAGQARAQQQLKGQGLLIERLKQRINQLQRGSTPQLDGFKLEADIVKTLRSAFPGDAIQPKGKGGDILQTIFLSGKPVGVIIYECKQTARISNQHCRQAFDAKQLREADFAILVHTGRKQGFHGVMLADRVLVLSPPVVVPVITVLRVGLIATAQAQITREKRLEVGARLLDYVTSRQFTNPLEEIDHQANDLMRRLRQEIKSHLHIWHERWKGYHRIKWDTAQIEENVNRVLHGRTPALLTAPKAPPLELKG